MKKIYALVLTALSATAALTAAFDSMAARQDAGTQQTPVGQLTEEQADSIANATFDELDEVVVTGVRPVVQIDGATTTYNVDEDPGAGGSTLLDLLRKVPMVTVDGDDNIRINGQQNFKIYVNGREDPSLSANASRILKAMPATMVAKIEVITEPGAKYDAEGTGGILNLVTERKQTKGGYSGNLNAYFNNRMAGGGVSARMKTGNVTGGINFDYTDGTIWPMKGIGESETVYTDPATGKPGSAMISRQINKNGFRYFGGGINLSWEPNERNLFTLKGNAYNVNGYIKDFSDTESMYEVNGGTAGNPTLGRRLWSYTSQIGGALKNLSTTAELAYQHNFSDARHFLTLSYLFSYGHNSLDTDTRFINLEGYTPQALFQTNNMLNIIREHTAQIDYTNDFSTEKHLLEVGAKGVWRRNNAEGGMATGNGVGDLTEQPASETDMTQLQDVAAVYASYTGTYGNLGVKGGLRYEHTRMGNRYHTGDMTDFTRNLDDVVPNAAVTYNFSPMSNLRLAYQMRISRPTIDQVTPYRFDVMDFDVRTGNPDLKSEHSNKVSLTYTSFGQTLGGNVGVEYSRVNDMIASFTYLDGDVRVQTVANIGRQQTTALFGFLNWTIIPRMTFGVNARLEYVDLKAPSEKLSNSGWSLNYGANWGYMLLSGWRFNAYGGHTTRSIELQGHSNGWHYYGVSVTKSLLKDQSLEIGVSANNMFEKRQSYKSLTVTPEMRQNRTWRAENWNVGVNISWSFGNLKQDVRKTSVEIVNDDKTEVKSRQGGI